MGKANELNTIQVQYKFGVSPKYVIIGIRLDGSKIWRSADKSVVFVGKSVLE